MSAPESWAPAMSRLFEQGYSGEQAMHIVETIDPDLAAAGARERAVERLIRIHAPEYRRLLAQERGEHIPGSADVDDDEFDLPGDEPPDPPGEE